MSLFICELAVRVVAPQPLNGTWRVATDRGYVVNRAGGEAQHDGAAGRVRYRFNDLHLRGGPVAPDGLRVLCVGDSFTFGWALPEEDTYVARLQVMADERFGKGAFQILNGGCGGWSTADYTAFVEDFGETIKPDVVVVFLDSWDIGRALTRQLFDVTSTAPPTAVPSNTPPRISSFKRFLAESSTYQWFLEHSHLVQLVRNVTVRMRMAHDFDSIDQGTTRRVEALADAPKDASETPREQAGRVLGTALFRRLAAWCETHHAKLFVTTTGRPEDALKGWGYDVQSAFKRVAPKLFDELHATYVEIAPEVAVLNGGRFAETVLPRDGHPNALGAKYIAQATWTHLGPFLETLRKR